MPDEWRDNEDEQEPRMFEREHDREPRALMRMSRRDMEDLERRSQGARAYLQSQRDNGETKRSPFKRLVPALETIGTALTLGWVAGRSGSSSIGASSVPLGLALGVVGLASNYMGWTRGYAAHVEAVSEGALSAWSTILGARLGDAAARRAGQPGGVIAGAPPGAARAFEAPPNRGLPPAARAYEPPNLRPRQAAPSDPKLSPLSEAELQDIAQQRMKRNAA